MAWSSSPFFLFIKDFLCSIDMSSMCSTLHFPGLVFFHPGTKTSRGLANVLGHFLAIYNPLFRLRIQVRPRSMKL